eukprot:gnl/TRDRNA2_/TRDRNA2_136638_c2_seq1.p1 gnl/TRDRNA2_/TRDRNA2_136638_c2~~gnl/TRDRNA2_/TRDRNA2_136638_c2_seq1.p1  ORF type:complete len:528 (-),score=92.30 gnl/TRDRNA2_/TRDRNA2_136638_c2_seq1:25-1470(-)
MAARVDPRQLALKVDQVARNMPNFVGERRPQGEGDALASIPLAESGEDDDEDLEEDLEHVTNQIIRDMRQSRQTSARESLTKSMSRAATTIVKKARKTKQIVAPESMITMSEEECNNLVTAMFRKSLFVRGLPLEDFQINLLKLFATGKGDLNYWLEGFEKAWLKAQVQSAEFFSPPPSPRSQDPPPARYSPADLRQQKAQVVHRSRAQTLGHHLEGIPLEVPVCEAELPVSEAEVAAGPPQSTRRRRSKAVSPSQELPGEPVKIAARTDAAVQVSFEEITVNSAVEASKLSEARHLVMLPSAPSICDEANISLGIPRSRPDEFEKAMQGANGSQLAENSPGHLAGEPVGISQVEASWLRLVFGTIRCSDWSAVVAPASFALQRSRGHVSELQLQVDKLSHFLRKLRQELAELTAKPKLHEVDSLRKKLRDAEAENAEVWDEVERLRNEVKRQAKTKAMASFHMLGGVDASCWQLGDTCSS